MKKILFILTILFTSCYWNNDLNDYDSLVNYKSRSVEYYWYYHPTLFIGEDSVQVIGFLSNYDDTQEYSVNRRVKVYNDTIYIQKRYSSFYYNIFKGSLYFNDKDPYPINTILH